MNSDFTAFALSEEHEALRDLVRASLDSDDPEDLEAELRDLGLLVYLA